MPASTTFHLTEFQRGGMPCLRIKDAGDLSPKGFDASLTFESGQCFRWRHTPTAENEKRYAGIVRGRRFAVTEARNGRDIVIENTVPEDFHTLWHRYLDLETDYAPVIEAVRTDDYMANAIDFAGGARLLHQDFEETLFSFILSSQNNIRRVVQLVEDLCTRFGSVVPPPLLPEDKNGSSAFAFPGAEILASGLCTDLPAHCGFGKSAAGGACQRAFAGYRCPYVARTALALADGSFRPDFAALSSQPADVARVALKVLPGVGDKVADCVLLYSGLRTDVCPVDTWVARVVRDVYLGQEAGNREIMRFAADKFGRFAGYAQFWFFIYARKTRG